MITQSVGLEVSRHDERTRDVKFVGWRCKFHVMSFLADGIPDGFEIFHLHCIHPIQTDMQCSNQQDWRSPRHDERTREVKFVVSGSKFHVMSSLTGWVPNGFEMFHLPWIHPIQMDPQWTNQVDQRSTRHHERTHDAKFVGREANFMS